MDFYNACLVASGKDIVPYTVTRLSAGSPIPQCKTKITIPINKGWSIALFRISESELVFNIRKRTSSYMIHIKGEDSEYTLNGRDITNVVQHIVDSEIHNIKLTRDKTIVDVGGWIFPDSPIYLSIETFMEKRQ